jgi:hypothetical protein
MVENTVLNQKVTELKNLLPKREWKYYHLGSIENFIYHLKSFDNDRTREWMSDEINNYLDLAFIKVGVDLRPLEKAMDLGPLIWKISDPYKNHLGFVKNPDLLITTVLAIVAFFLLKIFIRKNEALLLCAICYSAYLTHAYIKKKK